jgi:cytochrome c oxidase cbb3-type subunit III
MTTREAIMDRFPTLRARAIAVVLAGALGLATLATACESRSGELAAGGALPSTLYYMGPQPGPQRQLPVIVNPYASDRNALAEGRRLFVWYNCAGCHGDHAGGGMGPSLRDTTWIYGNGDGHIFASIAEGRAHGMPAWGTKLPQEQIWKLVAYVRSLRTPNEPSPPR